MISPREFYKEYWLAFYFWINENYLGGAAFAGIWIKRTHITRLVMNGLKILLNISMHAVLPLWLINTTNLLFMSINSMAIFVGAPSNTVKIQTYYNTEWELQRLNNEKGHTPDQEPPHGILHSHPAQQLMLLLRYLHDLNGFTGSIISILVIFSAVLTVLFGIALFSTGIGEILSLVALLSGVVSALGITYTYKNRLSVHTQNINDQINLYYDYSRIYTPTLHGQVEGIIVKISNDNFIKQNKYYHWIRFRCYRAVERALQAGIKPDSEVIKQELINADFKNILVNDGGQKSALLDGLAMWEEKLYQKLTCEKDIDLSTVCNMFEPCKLGYPHIFINYFKSAWLKKHHNFEGINNITNWQEFLCQGGYITYHSSSRTFTFNKDALKNNQEWAVDTSHGKRLLPTVHLKELAEMLVHTSSEEQISIHCPSTENSWLQSGFAFGLFLLNLFSFTSKKEISVADTSSSEQSIKQRALAIWYAAMPKKGGEYEGYDDHDPLFHGVMTFTMKFIMEALNNKLEIDVDILKDHLQTITQKYLGFAGKSFNLGRLKAIKNYCTTPWLSEASMVYSELNNYRAQICVSNPNMRV